MQTIEQQILDLESQLTGDLIGDILIRERIYHLKRSNTPKDIEGSACSMDEGCISCGS